MDDEREIVVVDAYCDQPEEPGLAEVCVLAAAALPSGRDLYERLAAIPFRVLRIDRNDVDACCRSLIRQRALLPGTEARPMRPSVLGLARLHRFVASPVGEARPIDDECLVRRLALRSVAPEFGEACGRRTVCQLADLRDDVFARTCALLCQGRGCPLAADAILSEIDRGMMALSLHAAPPAHPPAI